jgi:hypothetical protein
MLGLANISKGVVFEFIADLVNHPEASLRLSTKGVRK